MTPLMVQRLYAFPPATGDEGEEEEPWYKKFGELVEMVTLPKDKLAAILALLSEEGKQAAESILATIDEL